MTLTTPTTVSWSQTSLGSLTLNHYSSPNPCTTSTHDEQCLGHVAAPATTNTQTRLLHKLIGIQPKSRESSDSLQSTTSGHKRPSLVDTLSRQCIGLSAATDTTICAKGYQQTMDTEPKAGESLDSPCSTSGRNRPSLVETSNNGPVGHTAAPHKGLGMVEYLLDPTNTLKTHQESVDSRNTKKWGLTSPWSLSHLTDRAVGHPAAPHDTYQRPGQSLD